MMRRAALSLLVAPAVAALAAAPAAAQGFGSTVILFGNPGGHPPISSTNVPANFSGVLTISFHGDPTTGCAAQGICGYSGTVVLSPGPQGELTVAKSRVHGRSSYQVQLNLPGGPAAPFTAARVTRPGGGVCADAGQPNGALSGTVTGGTATIALIQPQGALLSTRCAGPLDGDLAGLGPQIRLPLRELLRGRRIIPLRGTWSFAAGGFAGTIDSSLTLALGEPTTQRSAAGFGHTPGLRRDREVTETLRLVRGSGSLSLSLAGAPSTCQFLDSCASRGTVRGSFSLRASTATLAVVGPRSRPYADYLAALGLSRKGDPRGLLVYGTLAWQTDGSLTEALQQGLSCTSTGPPPLGFVSFGPRGRRLRLDYTAVGPPRTRCPGPDFEPFPTLASATVGPGKLGQPSFTVHLSGSGSLADDAYSVSQRSSLTLTLRRGRVQQRTFLSPVP